MVEETAPQSEPAPPICLGGERACPPEDCGGTWGYGALLDILADPAHEEYEDRVEWTGEGFDPEAFDVAETNRRLQKRFPAKKRAAKTSDSPRNGKSSAATGQAEALTEVQGQYLSFIHYYTKINRFPPSESDLQRYFGVTGPAAHGMLKTLEKKGAISKVPGAARSIKILVSREAIPDLI